MIWSFIKRDFSKVMILACNKKQYSIEVKVQGSVYLLALIFLLREYLHSKIPVCLLIGFKYEKKELHITLCCSFVHCLKNML